VSWVFFQKKGYLKIKQGGNMKNLSSLKAIYKYCRLCVAGQVRKLKDLCAGEECGCPLYPFREGKNVLKGTKKEIKIVVCGKTKQIKNYTPIKAIRQMCIDCSGGEISEVRNCIFYEGNPEGVEPCSLWIYRMGKNPHRKGIGNKNIKLSMRNIKDFSLNDEISQKHPTEHQETKEKFFG
jgi:hypothetical protein